MADLPALHLPVRQAAAAGPDCRASPCTTGRESRSRGPMERFRQVGQVGVRAATTLREGFDALEAAQPRVLWDLVRPLAARGRPASAVGGLPYRLLDRVDLLSPQPSNAAHPSPMSAGPRATS